MPKKKIKLFDVTTRREWLQQRGTDYVPPKLDARRVPRSLRAMIPLAAQWGIADDSLRAYKLANLSESEFMHLYYQIRRYSGRLRGFLDNASRFDHKDWTEEESCFLYFDKCYSELSATAYWILERRKEKKKPNQSLLFPNCSAKAGACDASNEGYGSIMPQEPVASLLRLPKRKRLEIAESLWLSIADEAKMPVPAGHKRVLDERLAGYRAGKNKPISHEEMMRRLQDT